MARPLRTATSSASNFELLAVSVQDLPSHIFFGTGPITLATPSATSRGLESRSVTSIVFAVRVRASAEPRLSHEHDGLRWAGRDEALRLSVWPAYHESLGRIERDLADPETARWFELDLDGRRLARPPR